MAVSKNVIIVRFINIEHNKNGKVWFHYEQPLKEIDYAFFVSTKERKSIDIGSVIKVTPNQNPHLPYEGVVIDNVTVYRAKIKHKTVAQITADHLMPYLKKNYRNPKFAKLALNAFHKLVKMN